MNQSNKQTRFTANTDQKDRPVNSKTTIGKPPKQGKPAKETGEKNRLHEDTVYDDDKYSAPKP
ncbi:MAG: hypothetical protein K0Q79_2961 [Flavipsychrobacter sp.]|jgi:hypothetical protein|nr:hypothetical protein [Flavipsychrobacter sp.]